MENPTIEKFARCLSQPEWAQYQRSLVSIKPTGSKRPFFYVHPRSGSILFASRLALYLDPERPLYGLQSVGLDGKQQSFNRIEQMAVRYINEIKSIQAEEPYLLGGRCIGGLIALEMAQQLLKRGDKVSLLVLVESPLSRIIDPVLAQRIRENMTRMREFSLSQANHFQTVMNALDEATKHYKPQLYSGRIAYFSAEKTIHDSRSGFGWADLAGGGLEIHKVPGDHLSLSEEPHVRVFAEKLAARLDEAERPGVLSRLQQIRADLERSQSRLSQIKSQL